jgi:hypothetical protein
MLEAQYATPSVKMLDRASLLQMPAYVDKPYARIPSTSIYVDFPSLFAAARHILATCRAIMRSSSAGTT